MALRFLLRIGWLFLALLGLYFTCTYLSLYFDQSELEGRVTEVVVFVAALAGAIVWTRHDDHDDAISWSVQLAMRVCLAYMMLFYGSAKLLPGGQFTQPPLVEMDKPYYELSPFWRAWGFYAHSAVYNAFLGGSELLAGVLLLFERTKRLAVCMLVPILVNVALVNYAFSINVFYVATLLLIMSVALLTVELPWLRASFWSHTPFVVTSSRPRHGRPALIVAQAFIAITFIAQTAYILHMYPGPTRTALYGIWQVERSERVSLLPITGRLYVDEDDVFHVRRGSALSPIEIVLGPRPRSVLMRAKDGTAFTGTYSMASQQLMLNGTDGARVELRRVY